MFKKVFLLCLLTSSTLVFSRAQDVQKIEEQIHALLEDQTLPSLAIGVLKDGKVIYQKAFGYADVENKVKATVQTSYQLASLTKPITATAILKLHQQGLINLDDPITEYITVKKVDDSFPDPSIRQVLNHTAGLGTYFDIYYEDEAVKPTSFLEAWEKYGTIFQEPGKVCEYSNLGYGLLDYIISKAATTSYVGYLKDKLFKPLKMSGSFVMEKTTKSNPKIANKYDSSLEVLPFVWNNTPGAGNVASSVPDLLRFAAFHLQNLKTGPLDAKIIDEMQTYQAPNTLFHYYKDTYYGLGWYVMEADQGQKVVWHEGGMMGASTVLKLFPKENLAIVLLTNTHAPAICRTLTDKITSAMIPNYKPTPLNEIAEYQPVSLDTSSNGLWKGQMHIEGKKVPISLSIKNGAVEISYLDEGMRSFLTNNQPLPYTTKLFFGMLKQNYFLGTGMGELPASDNRKGRRHLLSFKLLRIGNQLKGTIVALAAADREYYAYPFYIEMILEK